MTDMDITTVTSITDCGGDKLNIRRHRDGFDIWVNDSLERVELSEEEVSVLIETLQKLTAND